MKKKIRILMISETFPTYHNCAGEKTLFVEKILNSEKIHTIRPNYEIWKEWAEEINAGKAILSLRRWTGRPYWTKMEEIKKVTKIGIQRIELIKAGDIKIDGRSLTIEEQAGFSTNDGLYLLDFYEWFIKSPLKLDTIVHFTDLRY